MNATKTYQKTADAAQTWAESIADDIDLDELMTSAEKAATKASAWVADNSAEAAAIAGVVAHKAGDWLESVAETTTDWLEDQSSKTAAMVPALATKQAKRSRRGLWLFGSGVAIAALFYFYDPDKGRARRAKIKNIFSKSEPKTTSTPSFSTQTVNEAKTEDLTPESVN